MAGPGLKIKTRLIILLLGFTVIAALLAVRVAWLQIVQGEELQKKAFEQQNLSRKLSPRRGTIYDRNGKELAVSASVETISVNPEEIKESNQADMISTELSTVLKLKKEDVLKKITKNSKNEIIQSKVDKNIGDQLRKWKTDNNIKGIYIDEDTKRYYPNRNLASHVIGFCNVDNEGIDGLEKMMNDYLKGKPGKILSEVDAKGNEMPFTEEKRIEPQDGYNVVTTIDETIQHFAEKAMEKAVVDDNLLNGATAIVMDPRNGEILAMTSKPDFDLNDPRTCPKDVDAAQWASMSSSDKIKKLQEKIWRNKAIVDTYEPGSTFKAITSAAGLEEGVVTPDTTVTDKTVTVGKWNINCWKPNAHGTEKFYEGVYNSCNPVFVRLAQTLGISKFYKYVKAFGFYDRTGITLPGEAKSIIHKNPTEIDMATASFGQRFQITPIQLIQAYGAIANGGKLYKPSLVKELTDKDGNVVKKFEPQLVRNVISKETSDTLRWILEGVVADGTGGNAYVKGFRVAGKTGTSQTTDKQRFIASFSAFAPADNPVICVLVVLDYPTVYPHSGGMIAAPVAGKLCEDILAYLQVDRKYTDRDKDSITKEVKVPNVAGLKISEAKKALEEVNLQMKIEGNSDENAIITDQTPKGEAIVNEKSIVIVYTTKNANDNQVTVPNLKNKTLEVATSILNALDLNISSSGDGVVAKQSVPAGSKVAKGSTIILEFERAQDDVNKDLDDQ